MCTLKKLNSFKLLPSLCFKDNTFAFVLLHRSSLRFTHDGRVNNREKISCDANASAFVKNLSIEEKSILLSHLRKENSEHWNGISFSHI